jgi:hypothetical protein
MVVREWAKAFPTVGATAIANTTSAIAEIVRKALAKN